MSTLEDSSAPPAVKALVKVTEILESLPDDSARLRVVGYVREMFAISVPAPPVNASREQRTGRVVSRWKFQ